MNKKAVGIISVFASCIIGSIINQKFKKEQEKQRLKDKEMVHDTVQKIFNNCKSKNPFEEETNKKIAEINIKHEKEMAELAEIAKENERKHKERMKELEKIDQEANKILDELEERTEARRNSAKTIDDEINVSMENLEDIRNVSNIVCKTIYGDNYKTSGQKLADKLEAKLKELKEEN